MERDSKNFNDLLENLHLAGLFNRVVVNPVAISPLNGKIVVLHDDFLDIFPKIVDLLEVQYTKSFVFLDPRGVAGIPYGMVRRFVAIPHADVMINWLYLDIQRRQGRESQAARASLEAMFCGDAWQTILGQGSPTTETERATADLEARLAGFYKECLQEADPEAVVKYTRLDFPDRDRAMFYLFLTTHDPTGGLELNQVLDDARLVQFRLKWTREKDRYVRRQEAAGQRAMFDMALLRSEAPAPKERTANISRLSQDILELWQGKPTNRKEIYRSLVDTEVYPGEINRALTLLKREKKADFRTKRFDEPISFAQKGCAP